MLQSEVLKAMKSSDSDVFVLKAHQRLRDAHAAFERLVPSFILQRTQQLVIPCLEGFYLDSENDILLHGISKLS